MKENKNCALLWDESFLWGLISYWAFKKNGLGFSLITSKAIREGGLSKFRALFVPGGWASNKLKTLGEEGAERTREFVRKGGLYIGICGGAGLATSEGLGLLKIKRRPLRERVPSLSGPVMASLSLHPIWKGIKSPRFHIWWPSQFVPEDGLLKVLARFDTATPETFSSDIKCSDVETGKIKSWGELESEYGLNLDPGRMKGDPLVIEGEYGTGRVMLSLVHFDTPSCANGITALKNLWEYFGLKTGEPREIDVKKTDAPFLSPLKELHSFGLRNGLWFERDWVVQWSRGVRGLEYFTLLQMAKELAGRVSDKEEFAPLTEEIQAFCDKSKELIKLEHMALKRGEGITFASASSAEMAALRAELFGTLKSHGGEFKAILDKLDALLYVCLKEEKASFK